MLYHMLVCRSKPALRYCWLLHKGVVDRDDKNVTSILEVLVVDVTGNVGLGARGAYKGVGILAGPSFLGICISIDSARDKKQHEP